MDNLTALTKLLITCDEKSWIVAFRLLTCVDIVSSWLEISPIFCLIAEENCFICLTIFLLALIVISYSWAIIYRAVFGVVDVP